MTKDRTPKLPLPKTKLHAAEQTTAAALANEHDVATLTRALAYALDRKILTNRTLVGADLDILRRVQLSADLPMQDNTHMDISPSGMALNVRCNNGRLVVLPESANMINVRVEPLG